MRDGSSMELRRHRTSGDLLESSPRLIVVMLEEVACANQDRAASSNAQVLLERRDDGLQH